jgi:hypothetical protein
MDWRNGLMDVCLQRNDDQVKDYFMNLIIHMRKAIAGIRIRSEKADILNMNRVTGVEFRIKGSGSES